MFICCFVLALLLCKVDSVLQNVTCPVVTPRELDWKALDGKWYIAAIASDLKVKADCAILVYNHMNYTDVSISWIANNTISYYNGSVSITVDPDSSSTNIGDLLQVTYTGGVENVILLQKSSTVNSYYVANSNINNQHYLYIWTTSHTLLGSYDQKSESYSFLDVDYEHYAVLFACYNNDDGNSSSYELWKLTRTPHLKESDAAKIDEAIANYSLQGTSFTVFNNTEDTCSISKGNHLDPSMILTSAAAFVLFKKIF